MKQEIVNAIAAYLEQETKVTGFRNNRHRIEFGGTLNRAHFTHAGFCQEIAQEIAAKIDPLLPKAVGWEDAPPWAQYKTTLEEWHEKEPRFQNHVAYKHWAGKGKLVAPSKVERRPNDQTPSLIR